MKCQFFLFLLTAIWLPHGQHWAIIEGTASPDVNHCVFLHFRPEGHPEPRNEVIAFLQ